MNGKYKTLEEYLEEIRGMTETLSDAIILLENSEVRKHKDMHMQIGKVLMAADITKRSANTTAHELSFLIQCKQHYK